VRACVRAAVEQAPTGAICNTNWLGSQQQGDFDEAKRLRQNRLLHPDFAEAEFRLGYLQLRRGDFAASSGASGSASKNARLARSGTQSGDAHWKLNEHDTAATC